MPANRVIVLNRDKTMKKTNALLSLLAAITLMAFTTPSTAFAADERQEHKELPATSGGTLTFKTVVGSIEIKTHSDNNVTYDADLKPGHGGWFGFGSASVDDVVFEYDHSGGDVTIAMKWKDGKRPRNSNLNARHTILVPANYNVDVNTSGGSISGNDINGKVVANTSGGSIRFGKINGPVNAHTSGGSVSVADIKGNADVGTSGGSIKVGNVDGNVVARTSGGSIKVGAVTGEMSGHTSGGSISAELTQQIEKRLELSTSGGSINLAVPHDFKADLEASTSGGKVVCDLPLQGTVKRSSVNGKVNGGGPQVSLHTSGGSINVAKR